MRLNLKKVSAIAASALMVGLTMGSAVAATNYPAPFVSGSTADVAVVYGASAPMGLDIVPAASIQSDLSGRLGSGGASTSVSGTAWQVQTGSDNLEIGESIKDVDSYIGSSDLALLTDETLSNEKGDAAYQQLFYWEDATSETVLYTEDDDDNIGLFFKVNSGKVIARYVMDFTTNLKSDIETTGEISDVEDKTIKFLGKSYTIIDATNGTSGVELTLMSGALKGTIDNDVPLTIGKYTVKGVISSDSAVQFTVTTDAGTETTDKMAKAGMEKLSDGNYIAVTDITYESFASGLHQATFYIGADKLEWKNNTAMTHNGNTISDATVKITATESGGDISISEVAINMTAEDDLYVPINGKLSAATDLTEPEVLVGQNWDIEFKGLEARDYEDIKLEVSESDQQYDLRWINYNGDEVVLPLAYANASGTYAGDDHDKRFVLYTNASSKNETTAATLAANSITEKDYFLLHTADPRLPGNDAKTILIQYDGADKWATDSTPQATFTINPGPNQVKKTMAIKATTINGTSQYQFTLKEAGAEFTFYNTSAVSARDFSITLSGDSYISVAGSPAASAGDVVGGQPQNVSVSTVIRTYYNTMLNVTSSNYTIDPLAELSTNVGTIPRTWIVNATVDDTNRDGEHFTVPDKAQIFQVTIGNGSTSPYDATATLEGTSSWITDNADSNKMHYITNYGSEIDYVKPSDSPASVTAKNPKSIAKPLVYVTSGEVSVSTGTGSSALGEVLITDAQISTMQTKNLIVVGGSCINTVAAKLLGSAVPVCTADFTAKTGIGSNQFLIQSFASPYTTGQIALLVAGYEAEDTANAATYLKTHTPAVDTTVGTKYKGTNAQTAELVTTTTTA